MDIVSLYRYIKQGKKINPLTRIPLDLSTLQKMYDYEKNIWLLLISTLNCEI